MRRAGIGPRHIEVLHLLPHRWTQPDSVFYSPRSWKRGLANFRGARRTGALCSDKEIWSTSYRDLIL